MRRSVRILVNLTSHVETECSHLLFRCDRFLAQSLSLLVRREVQHIRPLPITRLPIKLALVVLPSKRLEQPLCLRATAHDRPRLRVRLPSRALPEDPALVSGQERADRAEREADARAALRALRVALRLRRPLVRPDAVQPPRVRREAHDEHRVVRERNALRPALPRGGRVLGGGRLGAGRRARARERVLLRAEGHEALRAEADVHDLGPAHDVDRLVGVLGDVVGAGAVVLDQHVVHGLVQGVLDVLPDARDGGREGQQRRRLVGWVAVYGEAGAGESVIWFDGGRCVDGGVPPVF